MPKLVRKHTIKLHRSVGRRLLALSNWGNRWSGLIGILVALVAVAGTWYSGLISREHNMLTLKPNIRFAHYLEGEGRKNGIYIFNLGLGPARLTKLSATINGDSYDLLGFGGQRTALKAMGAELYCFLDTPPEVGTILKVGDEQPLFAKTNAKSPEACSFLVAIALMKQPIELNAEYLSHYDQKLSAHQIIEIDKRAFTDRIPVLK
jgi:hypothetical protein